MNAQSRPMATEYEADHPVHTVLIVEDETLVRMPIAEYLRDCGYNVVEAGCANEAIEAVEAAGPVSLVFSDIRMPGKMDGVDLAGWFSNHYPDVPVLLTSGYCGERPLPSGPGRFKGFIEKPYSQAQVAKRIAVLLGA
jgi:two-component system, response regulator PdtaR